MSFGERLAQARKEQNMTVKALASACWTSTTVICHYEKCCCIAVRRFAFHAVPSCWLCGINCERKYYGLRSDVIVFFQRRSRRNKRKAQRKIRLKKARQMRCCNCLYVFCRMSCKWRRFPVYMIHNTIKALYLQAKICYAKERFCCAFAGVGRRKTYKCTANSSLFAYKMSFPARIRRVAAYPPLLVPVRCTSYLQANARRRVAAPGIGGKQGRVRTRAIQNRRHIAQGRLPFF